MTQATAMILSFGFLFLVFGSMFFLQMLVNKRNHKEAVNLFEQKIKETQYVAKKIPNRVDNLLDKDLKNTLGNSISEILSQFEKRVKTFEKKTSLKDKYDFTFTTEGEKLETDFKIIYKLYNELLTETNILKLKKKYKDFEQSKSKVRNFKINDRRKNNSRARKNDEYYQNFDFFNHNLSSVHILMLMVDNSYDNEYPENKEFNFDRNIQSNSNSHSNNHSSSDYSHNHSSSHDNSYSSYDSDSQRYSGGYDSHSHNDYSSSDYGGSSYSDSGSSGGWD